MSHKDIDKLQCVKDALSGTKIRLHALVCVSNFVKLTPLIKHTNTAHVVFFSSTDIVMFMIVLQYIDHCRIAVSWCYRYRRPHIWDQVTEGYPVIVNACAKCISSNL